MEPWLVWLIVGAVMILLEFVVPGGIIVFIGMAAAIVGAGLYFEIINTLFEALITFFTSSIFMMLFLRSIFIKYFEGDSVIQNTNEDIDLVGSVVEAVEDVHPYKEGRVRFRDSTWSARSDEEIKSGSKATVSGRDGNILIIKPL